MLTVLILNDKSKNNLGKEIFSILSEKVSCVLLSNRTVLEKGDTPEILLIEAQKVKDVSFDGFAVILGEGNKSFSSDLKKAHTVIVDSNNKRELLFAKKFTDSQIAVCGMSVRDTVTITSNIGENATVSLNRNLKGFESDISLGTEVSLKNNGFSNFSINSAGVIFMLSKTKC